MAEGYLLQRLSPHQAAKYASEAISVASSNPDAGSPKVANEVLIQVLSREGETGKAKRLVINLLRNPGQVDGRSGMKAIRIPG